MKDKVLVAMSGGVDSSVTLLRIIEMGYEAIGVTMKLWEYKDFGGNNLQENNCCAISSINKAKLVCERMGVPHYTIDFTESFRKNVVDNFVDEYIKGRTPNPCVRCNSFIKWDTFIEQAKILGAKYIATGHYAQIDKKNNNYFIKPGVDEKKDQSYVLWGIPKETLSKTILPLGALTKEQVRQIARDNNLETAEEPESMEICFIADNNYKRFINEYAADKVANIKEGKTLNESGEEIGSNEGYTNYTIGQRRGIGISNPNPLYVKKINSENNTITVAEKNSLFKDICKVEHLNWLIDEPELPMNTLCQIRYNGNRSEAKIYKENNQFIVKFMEPQLAITPGQSIVFYANDILSGGGIIKLYE